MIRVLSAIAAALLVGVLLGLFAGHAAEPLYAEPSAAERIQAHGVLELKSPDSLTRSWQTVRVDAICDSGNGAMIYVVRNYDEHDVKVALLPNGCQKAQAEK